MSIAARMARMWVAPRKVAAAVLNAPLTEPGALAMLLGGCALFFVAQWPVHARAAQLDPSVPLDARLGGALMATMFILPLVAYALAGLSQLVLHLTGQRPQGLRLRMALFWAILAIAPAMLLSGLVEGLVGPGAGLTLVRGITGAGFVVFWMAGLAAALKGA